MNREMFEREIRQAYLDGYDAGWAANTNSAGSGWVDTSQAQANDYARDAADAHFGPDLSTIDKAVEHFGLYATVSRIDDTTLVVITPDASEQSRSAQKELSAAGKFYDSNEVGGFIVRVVDFRV